jgi:phage FluMu protein Com
MASRKKTLNFIGNLIGRMAIFHVLFLAAFFACLNPVSIPVLDEFAKGVFDFRGITRKGTMSEKLVTGRCQHCDCHIEFDASGFQEGSMAPVKCPDCQMVTEVFIPQSIPPIIHVPKRKAGGAKWILLALAVVIAVAAVVIWGIGTINTKWSQSDTIQDGDIQVKIDSVSTGPVFINNGEGLGMTPSKDYLLIKLQVTNLNENRKMDFSTWRATSLFDSSSSLSDNFGNSYKRIVFDQPLLYMEDQATIYPKHLFEDTVIFETPVQNYQWLHLQLSARNFGGIGNLGFEIANSATPANSSK